MDYNGWSSRATWLVNVWYNPESEKELDQIKEFIEEQYDALEFGLFKDMIDLNEINWRELKEALRCDDNTGS